MLSIEKIYVKHLHREPHNNQCSKLTGSAHITKPVQNLAVSLLVQRTGKKVSVCTRIFCKIHLIDLVK